MERSDEMALDRCADCGADIRPGAEPVFAFGTAGMVCWDCALRRGGRYDAERERWSEAPDLRDLVPERE